MDDADAPAGEPADAGPSPPPEAARERRHAGGSAGTKDGDPDDDPNESRKNGFRGPLRYEFETSSPVLQAGSTFTIYLRITNPYDVPVEIRVVALPLPVEFDDVTGIEEHSGLLARWRQIFPPSVKKAGNTGSGIVRSGDGTNPFGPNVAIAVGINKRPGGHVPAGGAGIPDRLSLESVVIQPGNTVFQQVTAKTRHWLFFSPAVYNLEAWVSYVIDGKQNYDAVKVPLNIRAPLAALLVGAAFGATISSLFQFLRQGGDVQKLTDAWSNNEPASAAKFFVSLLSSVLLSAIAIVAFARKRDAQPFVSVEDIYGGLFIGFLVGLNGEAWLKAITAGTTGASVGDVAPAASAPAD